MSETLRVSDDEVVRRALCKLRGYHAQSRAAFWTAASETERCDDCGHKIVKDFPVIPYEQLENSEVDGCVRWPA